MNTEAEIIYATKHSLSGVAASAQIKNQIRSFSNLYEDRFAVLYMRKEKEAEIASKEVQLQKFQVDVAGTEGSIYRMQMQLEMEILQNVQECKGIINFCITREGWVEIISLSIFHEAQGLLAGDWVFIISACKFSFCNTSNMEGKTSVTMK